MKNLSEIFSKEMIIDRKISNNFGKIPRFVSDCLISKFVDYNNPQPGITKIQKLIEENFIESSKKELIRSKIKENGRHSFIGNIIARYDSIRDEYFADISVLGDSNIRIPNHIVNRYDENLLSNGGCWGSVLVSFDPNYKIKNKSYPFVIENFVPLQITNINLDYWINNRQSFDLIEWTDLLINSIGFNPTQLSFEQKLNYITRLLPFVESNLNIIELGPPESGKTYTYRLSPYSFVISGSQTTVASLFFNKLRKKIGLIGYKDLIIFDEISNANFNSQDELINILKDYLQTGKFGRDNLDFNGDCSIVFVGNIDCDRQTKSVKNYYKHLFSVLPKLIANDRAFLDRIHGFIPGWSMNQITEQGLSQEFSFMIDYLSEIFHKIRQRDYTELLSSRIDFGNIGQRNQRAVTKLASGLIKLLFPNKIINDEELKLVLDKACELRQRVVDQLIIISPGEFKGTKIGYELK